MAPGRITVLHPLHLSETPAQLTAITPAKIQTGTPQAARLACRGDSRTSAAARPRVERQTTKQPTAQSNRAAYAAIPSGRKNHRAGKRGKVFATTLTASSTHN